MKVADPDAIVLDEVATQAVLNCALSSTLTTLEYLDNSQRSWVLGKLAESYCPLCGRPRSRNERGRLLMCKHGDTS